jgi:phospholipase/lecithinase/hemolysin
MAAEWDRADGQASDGGDVQLTRKKFSGAAFALAACCSGALMSASAAQAAGFSAEYVFGDSLSDVGNVYLPRRSIQPRGEFSAN